MNQEVMVEKEISEYFEKDHLRLDSLFGEFQAFKKTNYPRAREAFIAFKFGLQRHIVWEEQILFPVFESKTGMVNSGPTHVMRFEHRQIGECLEALHTKVKNSDPASDAEEAKLLTFLASHNQKEEMVLYPTIDRMISEQEKEEVYAKMKALPEETYAHCCGIMQKDASNPNRE
ncbi:MAG TPA: hemerythrin domain-containing protein [Acidobacteriota bacterium]|nr:hemerythrin domain-containing protein [Acidobacteriota bacterium]